MKTPRFWEKIGIIPLLLTPISLLYYLVYKLRCYLCKNQYVSKIPVICVGNIVVGGAGKTPTAIAIGQFLKRKNKTFCFLSKGYKGLIKYPIMVKPTLHTSNEVGDESLVLAEHGDTFVSKNRVAGLKYINSLNKNYDYIIMDDGLQNPTFKKDISIIVINGKYGYGNKLLFPAGPLRDSPISALKKARRVIIIDDDLYNIQNLCRKNKIRYIKAETKADIKPEFYQSKFIAFAGIANPHKFFDTLISNNIKLVKTISFPDHYTYKKNDIDKLQLLTKSGKYKLITTKKDWVKITSWYKENMMYLNISIQPKFSKVTLFTDNDDEEDYHSN